jgi:site-specific DNA recombinase
MNAARSRDLEAATTARTLRCAIYTRKSSEEGLDSAFNSLDAQRQAGLDYIASQRSQGWTPVSAAYDDGGYSGGSTDRPALQRLLADIRAGRVDVVVVYKVDRLSRSLADFAKLMDLFDEHRVSFVSVTQQFNTTTSMGRLTLNMLLSFAQFEREVAGERVRDKIAATFRRGVFVTGQPPIGYRRSRPGEAGHGERTLQIVPDEAAVVRAIYQGYLDLGSLVGLAERVNAAGHRTKRWTSSRGRTFGGTRFSAALLHRILTNPIYLGKVTHTRRAGGVGVGGGRAGSVHQQQSTTEVHDAKHTPIVERALWDAVQARMATAQRSTTHRWTHTHLLKGKLRTFDGHAMSPTSTHKKVATPRAESAPDDTAPDTSHAPTRTRLFRFYVSQKAIKLGYAHCPIKTLNAELVDDLVRAIVLDHVDRITAQAMSAPRPRTSTHAAPEPFHALRRAEPALRDHWVREMIERVMIAPDSLAVELRDDQVAACADHVNTPPATTAASPASDTATCLFTPRLEHRPGITTLTLAIAIKRYDGRRLILSPDGDDLLLSLRADGQPSPRPALVRAIGQAYAWHAKLLRSSRNSHNTIQSLARSRGVDRNGSGVASEGAGVSESHIHARLTLTHLGPPVLRAILNGNISPRVNLKDLIAAAASLDWQRQAAALNLPDARQPL